MKRIIGLVVAVACMNVLGQEPAKTTLTIPPLTEEQKQHRADEEAAANASSNQAIWDVIKKIEASMRSYQVAHPGSWGMEGNVDPERYEAYKGVARNRKDANDPEAAFFWGVESYATCQTFQSHLQQMPTLKDMTDQCWRDSLSAFKIASGGGFAAASFNIGIQYEQGYGPISSKFAAADWFVRSANQFIKAGDRDQALQAVERALTDVPDHPAALRLKKALLQ